jgi:DNA-binding NarL/FixJ family response regulator
VRRVRVAVQVTDPLTEAGLREHLDASAGFTVTDGPDDDAQVRIAVVEQPGDVPALVRRFARTDMPTILIGAVTEGDLLGALDHGVMAVVAARAATAERLAATVEAVLAGEVVLPPGLVTGLVRHLRRVQREVLAPNGLSGCGLTRREVDVLRLLADGLDTVEIAATLNYAERTIKNVVGTLTERLHLRNRAHAVSYALRNGLI